MNPGANHGKPAMDQGHGTIDPNTAALSTSIGSLPQRDW